MDMMKKADIGIAGLAVMGANLALNMESKGYCVAVYNRGAGRIDDFMRNRTGKGNFIPGWNIHDFCASLKRPRRIMLMVKAGAPVDDMIAQILPELEKGDILIDGGNSHFSDTERRCRDLAVNGILFVGAGVSGGEEGALHGPSIMPGGNQDAWEHIREIFRAIAAKVDGEPCCEWIGSGGSGHFVKMLHNGIEYSDMQMISEAYMLLREYLNFTVPQVRKIFEYWNTTPLNSYLIEITAELLRKKDPETRKYVIDVILDVAGQKGTGKWTVQSALDMGEPTTTVAAAVFARCLSALKNERIEASNILHGPSRKSVRGKKIFSMNIQEALYASKICSYAQGFQLLKTASKEYNWGLDYSKIALIWRGGCIIRAGFLNDISMAFKENSELENLILAPFFRDALGVAQESWRKVLAHSLMNGFPVPAFLSALTYYDSYRSKYLPANLIQALRDYFGAHTYERTDRPRGEFFHTEWTGSGGKTTSTPYNV